MNPQDAKKAFRDLSKGLDGLTGMMRELQGSVKMKGTEDDARKVADMMAETDIEEKIKSLPGRLEKIKQRYEHTTDRS